MDRRARIVGGVAGLVGAIVIAGAVAVILRNNDKKPSVALPAGIRAVTIPGVGGAQLSAEIILPSGSGTHPLLVMPGSWGAAASEYVLVGQGLAKRGYVIISYAQRGFGGSTGKVDAGGLENQQDVSAVINWALKNTPANPKQIAAVGSSLGGGVALLAAERDPRIRVVVATSTWTDLVASDFPNRTPNQQVQQLLLSGQAPKGSLGPAALKMQSALAAGDAAGYGALVQTLSTSSSPMNGVAALNKNRTAVMIANGWQDSIFPPAQLVPFFNALTGPKRLQLAAGDHGATEISGLLGQYNQVWTDAGAWLDHFLLGVNNGMGTTQDSVQLTDVATGAIHSYPSWSKLAKTTTSYLTASDVGSRTAGTIGPSAGAWSESIAAGVNTDAEAGPLQLSVPYKKVSGIDVGSLASPNSVIWNDAVVSKATLVNGSPTLQVTVTPSATTTSLFAYLYDVDASGAGTLMSYEPYTLLNVPAGQPTQVSMTLQPTSWTVAKGHHLSLAIDTVDARFMPLSRTGSTLIFSSSPASPATFTVPIN
ncbi:MAG: alpha/beta fold hydrolase [Jatrophihabitantaceae bacterium]